MSTVGATIVVQFGEGVAEAANWAAVELDETLNVDADGNEKTQFTPGDEVWFWCQHDPSVRIASVACTSGMAVDCGTVRRERTQELTWIEAEGSVELSYLPAVTPVLTWYGNVGGGLAIDGRTASVQSGIPCTADAILPIDVHLYRYVPPPLELADGESWRSVVVLYLEAAA